MLNTQEKIPPFQHDPKLSHVRKLIKLRDALIPVMFMTQDYGLKPQEKIVSEMFESIFKEIAEFGITREIAIGFHIRNGILATIGSRIDRNERGSAVTGERMNIPEWAVRAATAINRNMGTDPDVFDSSVAEDAAIIAKHAPETVSQLWTQPEVRELVECARLMSVAARRLDHWHLEPCRFCSLVERLDKALEAFKEERE